MSVDVLLVVPYSRSHYVVPPLGLGYLATAVRTAGFDNVRILDCIKENITFPRFGQIMDQLQPRIVGFQFFSQDLPWISEALRVAREVVPDCVRVAGGPHVSAIGADILVQIPELDYAFVGEAEIGFPVLVETVVGGKSTEKAGVPGLVWRDENGPRANERVFIQDLDSLGFPAWDLMPPNTYPDAPQGAFYRQFPIAPMASSRGCPYSCEFCGSPVNMGSRIRFRSLPHVFREMERLCSEYGVREFHFVDDMFNLSKRRVIEFCRILEDKRWGISYSFPNGLRLNTIDREMLDWMKKTGAYAFTVGIESGSQRVLDLMNKQLTVEMIREKVQLIHEVGLEPSGFFLLGFPGETKQEMRMTLELAKSLPLKRAHFSNFPALPGTEATRKLVETGELSNPDWGQLCYSQVPYSPAGVTKEELKQFQRKAFLEFHLRPRILFKMLTEIKSPFHLYSVMKRARDYLFPH